MQAALQEALQEATDLSDAAADSTPTEQAMLVTPVDFPKYVRSLRGASSLTIKIHQVIVDFSSFGDGKRKARCTFIVSLQIQVL